MQKREDLAREHRELDALAQDLSRCAAQAQPDLAAAEQLKLSLSLRFAMHLIKEDRLVYPRVEAGADHTPSKLARGFAKEMGALADAFRDYVAAWPATRLQAEWPAFGIATQALMTDLRACIDREQAELYRLLSVEDRSGAA